MSSQASGSNGRRLSTSLTILTRVLNTVPCNTRTEVQPQAAANLPQPDQAETQAVLQENVQESSSPSPILPRDSEDGDTFHAPRQGLASEAGVRVNGPAYSPGPSPRFLEVPRAYPQFVHFPTPPRSASVSPQPEYFRDRLAFFRNVELPLPTPSTGSGPPSPLQEYHFTAANYHHNSAGYHDSISEHYDRKAEYHDKEVEYHHTRANFHRVQFLSPVATYFSLSMESPTEPLLPRNMQESVAGSIHGAPSPDEVGAVSSGSLTPGTAGDMSAVDAQDAALPVTRDFALPCAQRSSSTETASNVPVIKYIIRAKTPSFSSDSEEEVYHGKSVSMNSDKGWEPDVSRVKKNPKDRSSHGGSFSSTGSTVKPVFGPVASSGLQVPSFDTKDAHSRTSSGVSGLSRITAASGVTGGTATTGYLDQDDLMTRMLKPEQQMRNAENHVNAMREALAKAFKDREGAEDRTAVAEALLKSSLALRANERGETVLMENCREAEEQFNVSQALLEKSRERNVESEERALRAENLVQRMADKVKTGVPAIVNAGKAETRKLEILYKEATDRAKKAEQRLMEAETGLEEDRLRSYNDAIERAELAEKRAQAAEELQEKDRLWTVDADERAVHAENRATELRAELIRSENIIADLQILLMRARSRAEKSEQDVNDAEGELEAFENRAIDFEKKAHDFKTKYESLQTYNEKLQEHHNEREAEYMACNEEWKTREEEYLAQNAEWKRWCDESIAKVEELTHDKNLIISTFESAITKMKKDGKVIDEKELKRLTDWAAKAPELKKGKEVVESVALARERARRVASASAPTSASTSPLGTDAEKILAKQLDAVQLEDGVLRLPGVSKGGWYNLNKSPK